MNVWWCCQLRCRCEGSTCSEHWPDMAVALSRLQTVACVSVIINGGRIRVTPMTACTVPLFSVLTWGLISEMSHRWSVLSFPSHINHPEWIFAHRRFIFFGLLLKVFCFVAFPWTVKYHLVYIWAAVYTENLAILIKRETPTQYCYAVLRPSCTSVFSIRTDNPSFYCRGGFLRYFVCIFAST